MSQRSLASAYQPTVVFVACWLLGVVAGDFISLRPEIGFGLVVLASVVWAVGSRRSARLGTIASYGLVSLAGCLLQSAAVGWYPPHHIVGWASDRSVPAIVIGTVSDLPERVRLRPQPWQQETPLWRYVVEVEKVRGPRGWQDSCGSIEVWQCVRQPALLPGDRCRWCGHLSRPPRQRNPGDVDRRRQLARRRILAQLSVADSAPPQLIGRTPAFPQRGFAVWRRSADEAMSQRLSGSSLAISRALALGLRDQLSEETVALFQDAGISHLLAISGFHVGLLFLLLVSSGDRVGMTRSMLRWLLIVVVVLYAGMSGLRPSAIRATACVLLVLLTRARGRPVGIVSLLGIVAAGMVAGQSAACFDIGAQLSFLGVFLLSRSSLQPPLDERQWCRRRVLAHAPWWARLMLGSLGGLIKAQWATLLVLLGTQPLIARHFHRVAWAAILINPFAVLPTAIILASSLVLIVPGIGDLLAPVLVPAIELGVGMLEGLAQGGRWLVPPHAVVGPSLGLLVIGYLGLIVADRWAYCRRRRSLLIVWLLIWNGAIAIEPLGEHVAKRLRPPNQTRVTVIDVGHGTAVLVELSNGDAWLYDAGSAKGGKWAAGTISAVLYERRIHRLAGVFLSHPDRDHYNAMEFLLKRHAIDRVFTPAIFQFAKDPQWQKTLTMIRTRGIALEFCEAGDEIKSGGYERWIILHPNAWDGRLSDNEASLSLILEMGANRWLFAGDLEGEAGLAVARRASHCDFLMAPHHGGRSSYPALWVQHCQPRWLCISAAGACPWIQRDVSPEPITVLNTATRGAITFHIQGQRYRVSTWLPPPIRGR